MGTIRVMTPVDGDKEINWDPEDEKSTSKARKEFDKLKEKGHKMFAVVKETVSKKGDEVKDFDPTAKGYIAVPPMAGG